MLFSRGRGMPVDQDSLHIPRVFKKGGNNDTTSNDYLFFQYLFAT